ncbi:MAG: DUF4145 domain-containing protein [Nitrososphaerota archaeon]|jgi:hypothetical protein|nr:DUF4145 domain-containing protein [Nitrososphaerota archaeon]
MESTVTRVRQIVRAGNYGSFQFEVSEKKYTFHAQISLKVAKEGLDLNIMLLESSWYVIWMKWFSNIQVWKAEVPTTRPQPVMPRIESIYSNRTNLVDNKSFELPLGAYALVLDNTYSLMTDKTVDLSVTQTWGSRKPPRDLPVVESDVIQLPLEVLDVLLKANDCYISGHYVQSTVMFRKALDFGIRLKLLQSGSKEEDLLDNQGNELTLARKIKLLRDKNLISQQTSKHLETIKWFGDLGAHGRMNVVLEDVKDNIEPKVRAFFMGLNLRT